MTKRAALATPAPADRNRWQTYMRQQFAGRRPTTREKLLFDEIEYLRNCVQRLEVERASLKDLNWELTRDNSALVESLNYQRESAPKDLLDALRTEMDNLVSRNANLTLQSEAYHRLKCEALAELGALQKGAATP